MSALEAWLSGETSGQSGCRRLRVIFPAIGGVADIAILASEHQLGAIVGTGGALADGKSSTRQRLTIDAAQSSKTRHRSRRAYSGVSIVMTQCSS